MDTKHVRNDIRDLEARITEKSDALGKRFVQIEGMVHCNRTDMMILPD